MAKKPVITDAQPSKKGIAVGVAIRPESCLIWYDGQNKPESKGTLNLKECRSFIEKVLDDLKNSGHEIDICVISMFGNVDTYEARFLGTSVNRPESCDTDVPPDQARFAGASGQESRPWQQAFDFKDIMGKYVDPTTRLFVFNDATMASYHVFQNYRETIGGKLFLLITVRQWGIGFGLVFNGAPFSFGRSSELSHIPALRRSFPGEPIIEDINPDICRFHTSTKSISCINNLASGGAEGLRSVTVGLRESLQERFGSGPHGGYEFESFYLAQACVAGAAAYSPVKIVVSGEYMNENIMEQIRYWFGEFTNGFPPHDGNLLSYEDTKNADIAGALRLAREKAQEMNTTSSKRTAL